ncbi:MAG: Lrp/AsnC family transcriptional regulator [Alphaproteobacteria bacterium]|uniref:Lrp/AsnC family transcriptional regulator n=1 Tax=Rhizobium/Agrobacterium group TaxID=227290 RepID=UPI0006B8EE50|nr:MULTISPECIES: Lrp/AsnC family transcriptional regulator [Rhizobium/Agrobacterium group]MBU0739496.1 Lrp/AsnC family transcriptional regulator [Alphaproteobacteria bacterium]AOG08821.1 asnC-type helix-turn-helix domain protein [Agrobacterium sp. RAC06]KPF59296.1 AsnC family transcriptional regulator [Rhizobium sp. AAP116]MBU0834566.1 Lrp/AsnC family transcriptional regulator [Alphaproteobacteria bacterium]MBU1763259.1 Lrp/AsnC family transcriptional regulator [Alphaproteobacteria bacterium]
MEAESATLDRIDRKIIACLLNDASLNNAELAERVGLTAAPLSRRLARLYSSGIIRQAIVVDAPRVGLGLQAFVEITLDRTTPQVGERFIEHVGKLPEVVEIHAVAGGFDFLLKISVRDMTDYKRLIWQEFDRLAEIKTIRSTMVFDSPKISYGYLP